MAFLGTAEEVGRNAFHFPPLHLECASALVAAYAGVAEPVCWAGPGPRPWALVTTAGFEFVRPTPRAGDRPAPDCLAEPRR